MDPWPTTVFSLNASRIKSSCNCCALRTAALSLFRLSKKEKTD